MVVIRRLALSLWADSWSSSFVYEQELELRLLRKLSILDLGRGCSGEPGILAAIVEEKVGD